MPISHSYFPLPVDRQIVLAFNGETPDHWRAAAKAHGFSLLGRAVDRLHVVLGCAVCNSATLKRISVVLSDKPKCGNCLRERREATAAIVGAKLLGRDPEGDHSYGAYQLECGHVDRRQHGRVEDAANGGAALGCTHCTNDQHAAEADTIGWRLIGPAVRPNQSYREYEHSCGHRQDVSVGNMRAADVNCAGCKEAWTSKPSKIYVFGFVLSDMPVIKLGYSNMPRFRLKYVQVDQDKTQGKLIRKINIASGHAAICLEKAMHRHIKQYRAELIVAHEYFRGQIRTTSEIYHEHGRDYIMSLVDAVDAGWDPNLGPNWEKFATPRTLAS